MPTKTNNTTKAIIDYTHFLGGAAFRVNTSGIPILKGRIVIGWRPSQNKGAADIRIVYQGLSIDVEVKTGKDKQSIEQAAFQQEIEKAGGQYWLVENLAEFITKFEKFLKCSYCNGLGIVPIDLKTTPTICPKCNGTKKQFN